MFANLKIKSFLMRTQLNISYSDIFKAVVFGWFFLHIFLRGCRGRDGVVVGFTTTCAISAYHHSNCEFKSR
jgi:hypothetical protein